VHLPDLPPRTRANGILILQIMAVSSSQTSRLPLAVPMAAALLVLLALATPAMSQTAGEKCGPSYATNEDYRWFEIQSSQLATLKGSGAEMGADGCATSDQGQSALVAAQLPIVAFDIHSIATTASWKGDSVRSGADSLLILAGNANTTGLVKNIRGSDADPEAVLRHFSRCYQRRNYTATGRKSTIVCNPEVQVTGQWVVFIAKGLQVCNVMVCAVEQQYSPSGVPRTRKAALALVTNPCPSEPLFSSRSAGPDAVAESCAGVAAHAVVTHAFFAVPCHSLHPVCVCVVRDHCDRANRCLLQLAEGHLSANRFLLLVRFAWPKLTNRCFCIAGYTSQTWQTCPAGKEVCCLLCTTSTKLH
jgi:hypothetical protein